MTFGQWCAGKRVDPHSRLSFEAVWDALISGGKSPRECGALLDDVFECVADLARDLAEEMADDAF